MTRDDVTVEVKSAPAPQWRSRLARFVEELIARGVGLIFFYAGGMKAWDGSKVHRVLAFDGVPQPLIVPLTHAVWVGEIVLGLLLVIGIARRRAVVAAVLLLFVYTMQLAFLIAAQNPPDCACLTIAANYASAKQTLLLGLVRNAAMAASLEWVRLRGIAREWMLAKACATGAASSAGARPEKTNEDG